MKTIFKSILALAIVSTQAQAQSDYALRFSDYPMRSHAERQHIDLESLKEKSQLELDLLYSQLTSGPLPQGPFDGYVVFDGSPENDIERILGTVVPPPLEHWMKKIGTTLWRGKTFDAHGGTLTNRMGPVQRFPAKVYCGQSLLDSRRESIVLDYAYGDTLPGYVEALDWPMTRKGLSIRDEMRMVHPGLYLGRAYIRGLYALNFILYSASAEEAGVWTDRCQI